MVLTFECYAGKEGAHFGVKLEDQVVITPDYVAMARAFRWTAETASSLAHLEALLSDAYDRGGPTLIEVRETAGDRG